MKLKTLGRVVGAFDAAAWTYGGYLGYRMLSSLNYNKLGEFFNGDYPLEHKAIIGLIMGLEHAFVPIVAMGITDGLVDVIKGTHHYFGMQVWQKITKNPQKREQIRESLEQMSKSIERTIS